MKSVTSTIKAKGAMMRAELTTTCAADIQTLPIDCVHHASNVTNSALYLDKSGYGSNNKIYPAELLPRRQDKHCILFNNYCGSDGLLFHFLDLL